MDALAETGRKLRTRERRRYTEEYEGEEEIEEHRMFSVEEKLLSDDFDCDFVKEMNGEDLTLKYLQQNGFVTPIVVKNKDGLGIKIPDKSFSVNDVRQSVGSRRTLDVMNVTTQKELEMTMKEWCAYFEEFPRDKLLNVISLEFSHTKLESQIESPNIVRQLDWVDWVWPKHLKESQKESTNAIDDMKYPKVQKYCLMSVKGCYTDFHIDFGGTSVWYHILKGQKVFWLIPPSEKNIQLFEQWILTGKQTDIFFGDTVEQCARICLHEGDTFFIPTGWVHAVYTPEDSLVFGGNFLHSFGIEKQLRIAQVEDTTKVPVKFRYPFYNEMLWYVLERYVHCITGKTHMSCNDDGSPLTEAQKASQNGSLLLSSSSNPTKRSQVHLTPFEMAGLKSIIMWLSRLSNSKRAVPELIVNPEALLNDAKLLVDDHANDDHDAACTGKPVLFWKAKSPVAPKPGGNGSALSLTAQLRQMKGNLFSNLHKQNSKVTNSASTSQNNGSSNNSSNGNHESTSNQQPSRPESPPTRPISSNQYSVNSSSQVFDHIPSSFAELIATTGGCSNNVPGPTSTAATSPMSPHVPVASVEKMSFSTQTMPCSNAELGLSSPIEVEVSLPLNGISVARTPEKPSVNSTQTETSALTTPKQGTPGKTVGQGKNSDSSRRRRTRCKKCEACVRADCGECHFCKDMKKFGGPGRMKQSCIARQCMCPVLPHTACCIICGRDGWEKMITTAIDGENLSSLMECSNCWEILHPICLKEKNPELSLEGARSDDLPNSWECPKCVAAGKSGPLKPVRPAKQQTTSIATSTTATNSITAATFVAAPVASASTTGVKRDNDAPPLKPAKKIRPDDTDDTSPEEELTSDNDSETSSWANNLKIPNVIPKTEKQSSATGFSSSAVIKSSFVKSSARFPLLQEAINQEEKKLSGQNLNFSSVKQNHVAPNTNVNVASSSRPKKSNETLKDRLFRSLKGLKKRSETRTSNSHSPNFGFLKKPSQKSLSLKLSDSSSCGSNSALNSPTTSVSGQSSGLFGIARQTLASLEGESNNKSRLLYSQYEDDTDDETDQEISTIYEKSFGRDKDIVTKVMPTRKLIEPMYVVRPAPLLDDISESEDDDEPEREEDDSEEEESERSLQMKKMLRKFRRKKKSNLALERDAILPMLQFLARKDLKSCMLVCRLWSSWCIDPSLWEVLDLSGQKVNSTVLIGIVKRQPRHLNLSWTNINKRQLSWLIARIPRLQTLSLSGCDASAVCAINTCNCPLLKRLDVAYCRSLNDELVRDLASTPNDSRPGLNDTKTRLRHLTEINLAGTDITDASLRLISHHLPQLTKIDLSSCQNVTDMGIAILGAAKSTKLTVLNVSSCGNISDTSLDSLKRCSNLSLIDLRQCNQVTQAACQKFVSCNSMRNKFILKQSKLIEAKA